MEAENIQGKKDGKLGGNFSYVETIHKKIAEVLESPSCLNCSWAVLFDIGTPWRYCGFGSRPPQ